MKSVTVAVALSIRSKPAMTTCGTSSLNLLLNITLMAIRVVKEVSLVNIVTTQVLASINSVVTGKKSLISDQAAR